MYLTQQVPPTASIPEGHDNSTIGKAQTLQSEKKQRPTTPPLNPSTDTGRVGHPYQSVPLRSHLAVLRPLPGRTDRHRQARRRTRVPSEQGPPSSEQRASLPPQGCGRGCAAPPHTEPR